jgi:hypothetical protein
MIKVRAGRFHGLDQQEVRHPGFRLFLLVKAPRMSLTAIPSRSCRRKRAGLFARRRHPWPEAVAGDQKSVVCLETENALTGRYARHAVGKLYKPGRFRRRAATAWRQTAFLIRRIHIKLFQAGHGRSSTFVFYSGVDRMNASYEGDAQMTVNFQRVMDKLLQDLSAAGVTPRLLLPAAARRAAPM